jgi:hypothetical protein
VHEVEHHVDELRAPLVRVRVLQRLEARGAVGQHHRDLAVEHRAARGQRGHAAGHRREPVGPVLAVAAQQAHAARVDPRDEAIAVELTSCSHSSPGSARSTRSASCGDTNRGRAPGRAPGTVAAATGDVRDLADVMLRGCHIGPGGRARTVGAPEAPAPGASPPFGDARRRGGVAGPRGRGRLARATTSR